MIRKHIISKEQGFTLFTNESSKFIKIKGIDIHYRDEGDGTPILLIHGLGGSLHNWDKITSHLVKHFRVIRIDLPGFGLSGYFDGIDVHTIVDLIHEFTNSININNTHIVGNSLGGWITWEFAIKYKEKVNKLVLMNSAGFFGGKERIPTFEIIKRPVFKKIMKRGVPRLLISVILRRQVYYKNRVSKAMIEKYYKMINIEGNFERLFSIAKVDLKPNVDLLHTIQNPTLIIWGKQDTTQPVEYAYEFKKRIPQAEIEIYDKVGHIPMIEEPHRTFADVLSFLIR